MDSLKYFFDHLKAYQDHDHELPVIADMVFEGYDRETGERVSSFQPAVWHEGSYCTSIRIRISGSRLYMQGNPSRINRLENLDGVRTLDECFAIYNRILRELGLPEFTPTTALHHRKVVNSKTGEGVYTGEVVGVSCAVIQELHVTRNITVGEGATKDYIKAIATLPYRNMIPHLFENGYSCDWKNKKGERSTLIYPSLYDKANELELHSLPKIKKTYGADSDEYKYLSRVIDYCRSMGVVRWELKLRSRILQRMGCKYWGTFESHDFEQLMSEFCSIDKKLKVTAMKLENIAALLFVLLTQRLCMPFNGRAAWFLI